MNKLIKIPAIIIILLFVCSQLQSKPDPFDKDAITTSLKDAYLSARWVENFERYIKNYSDVKSLKELNEGPFRIEVISYCLKPGVPVNNSATYSYVLGPLKGNKAGLIKEIIKRSASHKEIEQKYVQTLLWGILAGFGYSDFPDDFKNKISFLLPEDYKNAKSKVNIKDILNLPLPKEVKEQMSVVSDLRKLISEGINRYDEIERISMPQTDPEVSKNDVKIDENCWTLMDNGYYVRAKPGGSKTKLDIYKPEEVTISYDEKGRVKTMSSVSGTLELEYDDNPGADIITYPSSKSYKINRVSGIKLNGEPIGKVMKMLWYTTIDNHTTQTSQYKRKEIGIVTDPLEASLIYRDVKIKNLFDYLNKYNKNQKLSNDEEKELYELKQIEYCMKFVLDSLRFQVKEESIEKIIRIATDAAVKKFTEKVKVNNPKGGSLKTEGFDFGFNLAIPGNNAQRIGVTGQGSEEGVDPGLPPVSTEGDPPPPPPRDTTREPVNCRALIKSVDKLIIPAPMQLYAVTLDIECEATVKEIEWILFDVSKEQGRCLNDKNSEFFKLTPDWDLTIEEEDNPGYTITRDSYAFVAEGRTGASRTIYVRAHDYGAFGKVSARIKVRERFIEATSYEVSGSSVNIPYDMNDNKIADKWEEDNRVFDLPPDSDDDNLPMNQAVNGDGMTIYEEYRGFYELLPDESIMHIRMDPNRKELFIIDDNFMLSQFSWQIATGIPIYRLNEQLVYGNLCGGPMESTPDYRLVNFCRNTQGGQKYAVNLVRINGIEDPYNLCGGDSDTNYTGCSDIGPPKFANVTIVMPDRLRRYFELQRNRFEYMLSFNPSQTEFYFSGLTIDRATLNAYMDVLNNPRKFNMLTEFMVRQNALHETGHACGIEHHSVVYNGSMECPMRYMNYLEEVMIFDAFYSEIFQTLYADGTELIVAENRWRFCTSGDNCWGKINVNDRSR